MSKLDKLLNKFSEEPTEDELAAEFLEILRVGDDCFQEGAKNIVTKMKLAIMHTKKTHLGKELEVGDVLYFAMLKEKSMEKKIEIKETSQYLGIGEIDFDASKTVDISIKLITISEDELPHYMLSPNFYLRRIIILNNDDTHSIDRTLIKTASSIPHLILKMSEKEVKESGEFIYFKYVKKNFKKSNKK